MSGQGEHAHRFQIVLLGDIAHGEEVALGLGHLLVVDVQEAVVHPVVHVRLAGGAAGLGDFVLVVREEQILAAAVDIKGFAQIGGAHGGAFDMPTGTAHAPGAFPSGFAGLLRLPESEVQRIFLLLIHADAGTGSQILQILAAEAAIVFKGLDAVVHIAVAFIGQTLIHQLLDHSDDLGHMLGGAGMHRGGTNAQRLGIHEVFTNVLFRNGGHGGVFLVGAADHLVVDVGEVLHKSDFVALVLKVAAQHIEHDERTGVADVEIVIHGGAAGIDAHFALMDGLEFFLLTGHAVVNLHMIHSFAKAYSACWVASWRAARQRSQLPSHLCRVAGASVEASAP